MNNSKKIYKKPVIAEIRLDNEISLQLTSQQGTSSPYDPFNPPAGAPASRIVRETEDPYQYENW